MNRKWGILITEDHTLVREGLRSLLTSDPEFEIVGEAADGLEVIRTVERVKPDLVLLDLSMPRMSGLTAIKEIKKRASESKILVLTVHKSEECIREAFRSGANGYCLKDATHAELLMAVRSVLAGKPYLSPDISAKVLEGYLEASKNSRSQAPWDVLTQREREVLKLIGEGYKNKEIADFLCISVKTTEKHRANIMKKLDLHNAASLTAFAIEQGLVTK
jgi:DNA-binding NarL/FixJ family response regulator